jgi:citrate lyase subunit beta/citryl-CoA lyase
MTGPGMRLARSYLFAPGDNDRLLQKVFATDADAVVLDLEDAVAPGRKADARRLVAATLARRGRIPRPQVFVRINAVDTGLWADDLEAVTCAALDGIRVAKVERRDDLEQVSAVLDRLEVERHLPAGAIGLVATIETAAGVMRAAEIAGAPRLRGFTFGAADFVRDIAGQSSADETETLYARSHLVLVSRLADLQPPVAAVYTKIGDLEDLRRATEAARRLGFFGRSCIHPSQVPVVHEVFTPTRVDVERARAIVEAFDRAVQHGTGALAMPDGQFVDRAVAGRARAVLALADDLATPAPAAEPAR